MKVAKFILLLFLALLYVRGLFIPIMNNNSAHHANIALRMYLTGDYVSLIDQGHDYLDKPHLLFWLAALSYHVFGVTSFAYKFASFVFALTGIFSTYRLGQLLFGKQVGLYAALIVSSATAFILSTNDVRMDVMLTGCIALAAWQLFEYTIHKKRSAFFLSALALALGFSTKGMAAVALPALAILLYHVQLNRVRELLSFRWVGLALLTFLLVTPVLACFYLQFDLHPEKVIRGTSGHSGVLFMLVGQSVDRYSGKGWGSRASDPFFLVHTFLWAFLPWCILAYTALAKNIRDIVRARFRFNNGTELALTGSTLILFIIVSGSQFKNPHYVNLMFPFFAILTARFLVTVGPKYLKRIFYLQLGITVLMVTIVAVINSYFMPVREPAVIAGSMVILAALVFMAAARSAGKREQIVFVSLAGAVFCFFLLHFNFYPRLLQYQSGHVMAAAIKKAGIDPAHIRYLDGGQKSFSMEFSLETLIPVLSADAVKNRRLQPLYIFGGEEDLDKLSSEHIMYEPVLKVSHYNVTTLKYKFLDPATRRETLRDHYIVKVL